MCEDSKRLLLRYLDALDEYDRAHSRFLSAYRTSHIDEAEPYWNLWNEIRLKLRAAREDFRSHQRSHGCADAVQFDE